MKTELLCLVAVSAFTGLLWVPYVLDRMWRGHFMHYVSYHLSGKVTETPWAQRLARAHGNAVENLVVFASLVLSAHALGVSSSATINACMAYLIARIVHAIAFAFAIPWVRTAAFLVGFFCQAVIVWEILRWL